MAVRGIAFFLGAVALLACGSETAGQPDGSTADADVAPADSAVTADGPSGADGARPDGGGVGLELVIEQVSNSITVAATKDDQNGLAVEA